MVELIELVKLTLWVPGDTLKLLKGVLFDEVILLIHAVRSEWCEFVHLELFFAFPFGVRSPRNMVNNYYCHIFLFVTTEIKVFPNRLFDFCLNGETMVIDFSEDITCVWFWVSLTTVSDEMQLNRQENCLSIGNNFRN